MQNVQELAFDFKSLLDAIRIRNHVIEMFERADRETDPEMRREMLSFVIAGGGFAGVELAGALNGLSARLRGPGAWRSSGAHAGLDRRHGAQSVAEDVRDRDRSPRCSGG